VQQYFFFFLAKKISKDLSNQRPQQQQLEQARLRVAKRTRVFGVKLLEMMLKKVGRVFLFALIFFNTNDTAYSMQQQQLRHWQPQESISCEFCFGMVLLRIEDHRHACQAHTFFSKEDWLLKK
jgi:hypothetical protein